MTVITIMIATAAVYFTVRTTRPKTSQTSTLAPPVYSPLFNLNERLGRHPYPRLFVQLQHYAPSEEMINEAANWDLLVLDAEVILNRPEFLGSNGTILQINPHAVVLSYFSSSDVLPGHRETTTINGIFISGLDDGWYMKDVNGSRYLLLQLPDGNWSEMLNLTTEVNFYMADYLNKAVISTGLTDGIFYDWVMENISWLNYRTNNPNAPLDINNDGLADLDDKLNSLWKNGTKTLLNNSRNIFPSGTLVVGNGGTIFDNTYKNVLNGRMLEGFLEGEAWGFGWLEVMRGHYLMHLVSVEPKVSLIMANGHQNDFKKMRFALASTLMFDGYFCYTNYGAYQATWWYDEYSVDISTGAAVKSLKYKGYLGSPLSEAYNVDDRDEFLGISLISGEAAVEEKVWRRDFKNGIVLVNPSNSEKVVELNGEYKKIKGIYDPFFNDGRILSRIVLEPKSGVVLLRAWNNQTQKSF
ncbi:MAG: putative glycoside hydrolase [Candidatus Hadarchaeum sp.]